MLYNHVFFISEFTMIGLLYVLTILVDPSINQNIKVWYKDDHMHMLVYI